MPAGSDGATVSLPHTWRPFGVRMAGAVLGGGLFLVCALTWVGFDAETQAKFTVFQRGTVVAIGLGAFLLGFALTRSRVVAEPDRLEVVNGYKRREYDWAQIVAIRLPAGAPWVTLDLADGTTAAAMGIQGSDGDRSRRAVRDLRTLLAERAA